MEILEEDFSEEFLSRFGDKEKQYILDFCNTFQKTFPNVLDKQELLNKINRLKSFKVWDGNSEVEGHYLEDRDTGLTTYDDMCIIYRAGLEARDERNTCYHELLHLISYKGQTQDPVWGEETHECGLWMQGLQFPDKKDDRQWFEEKPDFDEIMNEFYTVKMLETEGSHRKSKYIAQKATKTENEVSVTYKGNGYQNKVYLAEIYDEIFKDDLLKAKLIDRRIISGKFNQKFENLQIDIDDIYTNIPAFSKIGMQISEHRGKAQQTALNIWKQNLKEKTKIEEFDLYEYLKTSGKVKSALPHVESKNKAMRGKINFETLTWLNEQIVELDERIIIQQLRPDLVGEQTETDKIIEKKQIRAVIDSLRDNIEGLTKEEIGEVSYGTIPEYMHSNIQCLIIKAGKKEFMTFTDEDEYRGSSEFSKLPENITQEIFGDNRNVEYAEVPTHRDKWSIIKDENRYMDPNQNPLELVEEKRLDGTPITVKEEKDIPDSSSLEEVSDDDDSKGTQKITKPIGPQKTKTPSQAFRDSVSNAINKSSNDEITTDERKIRSQAFRDAISKKRTSEKTGMNDVKKSQDDISLRKERADLIRQKMFGQLDEDRKRRLEKINRLLNIKNTNLQQFEANKKRQGQSR